MPFSVCLAGESIHADAVHPLRFRATCVGFGNLRVVAVRAADFLLQLPDRIRSAFERLFLAATTAREELLEPCFAARIRFGLAAHVLPNDLGVRDFDERAVGVDFEFVGH